MIKFTGHQLDAVVCLTVDQDEIVARLLQRAQVEGRADDTEDVIRRRQEVYLEQTEPLIEVYRSRGIVHEIDGLGEVAEVTRGSSRRSTSSRRADRTARLMGLLDRGIEIKTPEQIDAMRRAGLVVGRTLELLRGHVRAGITTAELDGIAEDSIRSAGATPSFLGYHGFPASICASVNDEVVHGIPGDRVLADGDVVSIDCGAIVDGWHGDAAITVAVGDGPAGGHRADGGHRGVDVARDRRRPPRRSGHRHLPRGRAPRPGPGPLRHRRGLHRARHRLRRCTSRPTCPTTAGRARARAWCPAWPSPSSR